MFRKVNRWLQAVPITEPLQRRHAVTLQVFAICFILGVVGLEAVRFARRGHLSITMAINGVNAVLSLAAVLSIRRGRYLRAAALFVIGFGVVQALAFSFGGLEFSRDGLKSIAVVLTLAALLLGRRGLWGAVAAFAAAMTVAWLRDLGHLGGTGPHHPPAGPAGVFWSSLVTFLVLAIVLDRFGVTVQETLRDRRRYEDQLRTSEQLFRVAFQTSPSAINITRLDDGVYVAVNDSFARLSGWLQDEAIGKTSDEMKLWVDREARDRGVELVLRDGVVRDLEARFRRRDGSEFLGSVYAQRFELAGRPHLLTLTDDITAERAAEQERNLLQAQLLQSQKLESIGRVAGGVAHDLNNMLTAVLGYTDLLDRTLTLPRQKEDLAQIRLGGERAAGLTRQLLSFARKQPVAARDVDLNALIRNLEGLLRRLLGEQLEFVLQLCEGEAAVRANPGQIEQVVLNLVVNARDATGGKGRLTVATRILPASDVTAERVSGLDKADHVVMSVSDTGSGMGEDVLQHLFEPFFTTKVQGKGTGLGLATSYGIVQMAGGQFGVETKLGEGSTFRVYLPRLRGARVADSNPPLPAPPKGGSETVLLVEDEQSVRELALRVLTGHGYRVLVAEDGVKGVEVAAAHPGDIDLLVTDVTMPRMGGRELAEQLRKARPGLRVLFASGYAESQAGLADLLQKPFTAEALLHRVRQALDA